MARRLPHPVGHRRASAGTTRLTSGLHGPNDHGAIADYLDHVRFSLRLLEELSQPRG